MSLNSLFHIQRENFPYTHGFSFLKLKDSLNLNLSKIRNEINKISNNSRKDIKRHIDLLLYWSR